MIENEIPETLTIADLARKLDGVMTRSTIQRYDDNPAVRQLMGKVGTEYPASSLVLWQKIAEARAQEPPRVRPETAGVFLEGLLTSPKLMEAPAFLEYKRMAVMMAVGHQDRVLNPAEAAVFLGVSEAQLREYGPKPFKRYGEEEKHDRYRLSDLLLDE